MAQRVYATSADYENFAEDPFEGDDGKLLKRLRKASVEVEGLTAFARYPTDEDGYPTDQDDADAFTEATCAIVEYWEETGDPSGAVALEGAVKIGSVSLGTTSSSQSVKSAYEKLVDRIGSAAAAILRNRGLLGGQVDY